MEPPQIAVQVLGGDAAEAAQEALDLAVAAIDRLDVQRAPDPLASGSVDALVRDVERRRNGRIAAVASETSSASGTTTGSSTSFTLFALRACRVWLRVSPARSAATRIGTCSREGRVCGPCRRGLRSSLRSSLRLSRTKVSSAPTIPASRSGAWRTAARKRCRQRCAVLGAIPQRSADSLIVSPAPSEAPKASQRSLWCRPDSAAPVSAPNVFPQSLNRKRRRPRALPRRRHNADSAVRHPRPARSPPARPRPPAGPTAPSPTPCAAPPSTHRHARTSPEIARDPSA